MYGKFEGFPPKMVHCLGSGLVGVMKFHDFSEFSMKVSRFHESYPPLKLTANAPKMDKKNQKESFISQPPICRGELFVSGRGQSTSHLFQVDKAYRGPRRCWLCQEVGLLTIFSESNSLLFDPMVNEHSWLEYSHFQ